MIRYFFILCVFSILLIEDSVLARTKFSLPFPLCRHWVSTLSVFAKEPKLASQDWQLPEEVELSIKQIFNNSELTDLEKFERSFDAIWTAKLASSPALTRFLMKKPLSTAKNQKSIFQIFSHAIGLSRWGPHYNVFLNRVVNDQTTSSGATEFLILSHELGHALHRNHKPYEFLAFLFFIREIFNVILPAAFMPHLHFRVEGYAIGAQYEYIRRIPKNIRRKIILEYRKNLLRAAEISMADRDLITAIDNSSMISRIADLHYDRLEILKKKPEMLSDLAELIVFGNKGSHGIESLRKLKAVAAKHKYGRDSAEEIDMIKAMEEILTNGLRNRKKMYSLWPSLRNSDQYKDSLFSDPADKKDFHNLLLNHLARLKSMPDFSIIENRYQQLLIQSLTYADLPKEQFIQKLRPFHGYDIENLNAKYNRTGPLRIFALTTLIIALPEALDQLQSGELIPYAKTMSYDVNFILQIIQFFVHSI